MNTHKHQRLRGIVAHIGGLIVEDYETVCAALRTFADWARKVWEPVFAVLGTAVFVAAFAYLILSALKLAVDYVFG